jgi:hypothetical protein
MDSKLITIKRILPKFITDLKDENIEKDIKKDCKNKTSLFPIKSFNRGDYLKVYSHSIVRAQNPKKKIKKIKKKMDCFDTPTTPTTLKLLSTKTNNLRNKKKKNTSKTGPSNWKHSYGHFKVGDNYYYHGKTICQLIQISSGKHLYGKININNDISKILYVKLESLKMLPNQTNTLPSTTTTTTTNTLPSTTTTTTLPSTTTTTTLPSTTTTNTLPSTTTTNTLPSTTTTNTLPSPTTTNTTTNNNIIIVSSQKLGNVYTPTSFNNSCTWEFSDGGIYVQFDKYIQDCLNEIYNYNPNSIVRYFIKSNGFEYEINLSTMLQENLKTGTVRKVKYSTTTSSVVPVVSIQKPNIKKVKPLPSSSSISVPTPPSIINTTRISNIVSSLSFPSYWTSQEIEDGKKNHGITIELKNTGAEYKNVLNILDNSNKFNILRIYKVINPVQYLHYQHWCDMLKLKYPDLNNLNEMYTFHGTQEMVVQNIVKGGFKYRFNSRCNYGKGNYFAKKISYSIDSNYATPNKLGERFIFICRVCVGQTKLGTPDMAETDDTFQTASNHDNPEYQTLFVTFDDHQSYPEFLIVFKK